MEWRKVLDVSELKRFLDRFRLLNSGSLDSSRNNGKSNFGNCLRNILLFFLLNPGVAERALLLLATLPVPRDTKI